MNGRPLCAPTTNEASYDRIFLYARQFYVLLILGFWLRRLRFISGLWYRLARAANSSKPLRAVLTLSKLIRVTRLRSASSRDAARLVSEGLSLGSDLYLVSVESLA
jgi:hypothetical protein